MAAFKPLSNHDDVRFGEGSHDVRNWKVRTRVDNEKVGEVDDVLLDENGRSRYLDVKLDGGRHVLVPSGDARVDPTDREVHLSGLDRNGLSALPEYDRRPESITPEYSRSLTTAYDSAYADEHHYDRADYSAGWDRDPGRAPERSGKLARLDELSDVDVASGQPDPRGWEVIGANGARVGKVDHLIGDTNAMKARYLTVQVDEGIAPDRRVLVPVGHVHLDRERSQVRADALDPSRMTTLPAYEGSIDREYETRLTRGYSQAYEGERHYQHPRYRSRALETESTRTRR